MTTIVITVTNDGSFDNTYELYDNNCNKALSDITVASHGNTSLVRSIGSFYAVAPVPRIQSSLVPFSMSATKKRKLWPPV